jgi:ribosomal protein S12 methylthiotransferase
MNNTVAMVSLGCAKNKTNSEQMEQRLKDAGYELLDNPAEAYTVVVNTCGFIESAKQEAINTILELAELKAEPESALTKLVVAGCLAQRYKAELLTEIPEIDALLGTGSYHEIVAALNGVTNGGSSDGEKALFFSDPDNAPINEPYLPASVSQGWAFLKIAEGCDNHCAYCVIPQLRGRYRSRAVGDIVREAQTLAANGVKELIVIAQDVTSYGIDLLRADPASNATLPELLRQIAAVDGIRWIRLHYLYPDQITDELIELIAGECKIVKYMDIPIQHTDDEILRTMNRKGSEQQLRALFKQLRIKIPSVVLRTTLITGLPGEDEAAFERLCDFLRDNRVERVGVFPYSPEEGTTAARLSGQVPKELAEHRAALIDDLQADISDAFNESRLGSTVEVLLESYDRWGECFVARSFAESAEVDGKIFVPAPFDAAKIGTFATVTITDSFDGELIAELT